MGFTLDISRLTRPSEHEVIDLPVFWSTSYPARLLTRHPDLAQPKLLYPYQRLHTARHYRLHSPYNDNRSHLQTAYSHRMSRLCKKVRQYLPALDSVHMAVCLMHSMRFKFMKTANGVTGLTDRWPDTLLLGKGVAARRWAKQPNPNAWLYGQCLDRDGPGAEAIMHATEVLDIEVFIFSGVGLPGQNAKQQRISERQMLTTLLAAEDHVAM
ncbi:uncharacterized protein SEPMUDRAFT_118939 [Sphaerulina musiva SO2202]|uniref:Uncharacterized protein n=1 Tax=Sphaerulina musiva (strain SO2202) TaxID=692275 RepID=N1QII5_SPHMS|nr:uncharacterized protein SEPMUDRAFT_118939 [Sphaerulina musiva SO2202]EMF10384.1 hypothetical protein SEPMUDRAFT_118939 [Sphaerulina musiva SO2202]